MIDIPFLDLKRVNERWAGEIRAAMCHIVERGIYVAGPEVELFEEDFARYCGTRFCIAVGNGFDALRLLLQASGLRPEDEVLVPANTFIATILAIAAAGLKPVLVDPDPLTFLLDPANASACITTRTRARRGGLMATYATLSSERASWCRVPVVIRPFPWCRS